MDLWIEVTLDNGVKQLINASYLICICDRPKGERGSRLYEVYSNHDEQYYQVRESKEDIKTLIYYAKQENLWQEIELKRTL